MHPLYTYINYQKHHIIVNTKNAALFKAAFLLRYRLFDDYYFVNL